MTSELQFETRTRAPTVENKRILCFLVTIAFTSALAVLGHRTSTASADEVSSQDLMDLMRANDAQFDRAIIKLKYTDLSTSPPPKSKLHVRLPNGRLATDVQSNPQKKPSDRSFGFVLLAQLHWPSDCSLFQPHPPKKSDEPKLGGTITAVPPNATLDGTLESNDDIEFERRGDTSYQHADEAGERGDVNCPLIQSTLTNKVSAEITYEANGAAALFPVKSTGSVYAKAKCDGSILNVVKK